MTFEEKPILKKIFHNFSEGQFGERSTMVGLLVESYWQMLAYFSDGMRLDRLPYRPHNTSSRYTDRLPYRPHNTSSRYRQAALQPTGHTIPHPSRDRLPYRPHNTSSRY